LEETPPKKVVSIVEGGVFDNTQKGEERVEKSP